jgi:hypothetical protein
VSAGRLALRATVALALAVVWGCNPIQPPVNNDARPMATSAMSGAESLGDDVMLISIPSDDDTLIGKVFIPRAQKDRTDVAFQANPCRPHLEVKIFDAHRRVSDTRRFDGGVSASALLEVISVSVSASEITDYQYDFNISRKMVADDTIAYGECCAKLRGGCGDQFVRELYYGAGTYRLLQKSGGSASVGVPVVAGGTAHANYTTLGEQSFRGYFAYKAKETPTPQAKPAESRVVAVPTDGGPDLNLPKVLQGAAAVEQDGPHVLITTKSAENLRSDQIKAIGNARKKQRRALKNLLAGPPYNTPPAQLNQRVEQVYDGGKEEDAYKDDNGDWFLKMRYRF